MLIQLWVNEVESTKLYLHCSNAVYSTLKQNQEMHVGSILIFNEISTLKQS